MPGSAAPPVPAPLVGVVMGSQSDWAVLGPACETLAELGVAHEARW
jgi:phosphoribosylcarboxyaminoimidazole (NCAIR) mutase